ncbi:hypothetical protein ACH4OW_15650 [Streptomyces sp. NPDC017056]|uniref:hypothetical protein n=1 Tax=Streptomyces sp. NPDC017056 TaxID=3364973 RepID=UPI0037928B26
MPASPALPAAARLPRTAVVRRALLAGLFLAGFVALGLALGDGAHAADRPMGMKSQVGAQARAVAPTASQTSAKTLDRASVTGAGQELERGGKTAVSTVTETPVGKAARPIAERTAPTAERAAEPVTAPVRNVVREVRQVAGAGSLPVELPGRVPGVDGNADGDSGRGDDGHGEQPGQDSGPQPGTGAQHAGTGVRQGAAHTNATDCASSWASASELRDASPQPAQRAGSASEQQPGQEPGGLPGQLPQGPAPSASHTAGDGHGPRGGDQFAAVPAHHVRFGLVPGGVLAAAEPPTRQRAADILEFPG